MTDTPTRYLWIFLAVMILSTALTWGVGVKDFQYKGEAELAFENGFPGELDQWIPAGDPSNISLMPEGVTIARNSDAQSYAMRSFALPESMDLQKQKLRIRGIIKTVKPARQLDSDKVAAFMIWFQDESKETIQYLTVQELTGDFNEYRAQRVVSIPEGAHSFVTTLINRESDGSFMLVDAGVSVVSTTGLFQVTSYSIFALWVVLFLVAGIWVFKRATPRLGITLGALLILTLIGVLLPDSITTHYINPVYHKIASLFTTGSPQPLGIIYKIGHFMFFFLVAFVLVLNRRTLGMNSLLILSYLVVFALATEGLQLFLFNRSTRLQDVAIDMAGVLLAWALAHALLTFTRSSRKQSRNRN